MTQGKCEGCKAYFQFHNGVKVVDVHRLKAKCPKCGEQLMTTSRRMKRFKQYRFNTKTRRYAAGAPKEVY